MRKIIMILCIVLFMPITVSAAAVEQSASIQDDSRIQNLYNYISNMKSESELLKDIEPKDYINSFLKSGKGNLSFTKISKVAASYIFKELKSTLQLMVLIIIISVMAALIHNLQNAFSNEKLSNIAYFACYSLLIIVIAKSFYIGVDLVKDTITKMTDFIVALVPVLMLLLASVGGITEVAVMDPIIIGAVNIGSRIYVNFIIPMILIGFVLQFVNNISNEFKIDKLTKLINQLALWTQGILMTIFIGTLTIRGITSKTIDEVTVKVSKYALDNFVPIVGKSLSDAISAVAGYSLLLKNALSGLGLIIIVALVLFPVIKIFIMSLLYKFTAALVEPISDKRIVSCVTAVGESLVLIMSCLISVSVMFFVMISIIASTGKAIMGG
jgi:stage III sporulation protein AE